MQRAPSRTSLKVEHLLASSALQLIFPAMTINREYFADGSMRQLAPINPAVPPGAERIFIVGAGRMNEKDPCRRGDLYPSLAQVADHVLACIFCDQLMAGIEQLQHVMSTRCRLRCASCSVASAEPSVPVTGCSQRPPVREALPRALIELGYRHTMAPAEDVVTFLGLKPPCAAP